MRETGDVASDFEAELPPDLAHLWLLRRRLSDWLAAAEVEASASDAIVLATHEAAGNAMQHAGASVFVLASRDLNGVTVVVRNAGRWKASEGSELRGRGLPLMRGLMSSVDVESDDGESLVKMRLTL
jgi:anti-sigma regulatory factor (Ser/Thr protein kinase)